MARLLTDFKTHHKAPTPRPIPRSLLRRVRVTSWLLRRLARFLVTPFVRLRVTGLENIPATGGAVLVANHPSRFDGLLLHLVFWRQSASIVSLDPGGGLAGPLAQLYAWGGHLLADTDFCTADTRLRKNIRVVLQASQILEHGGLLTYFPEGYWGTVDVLDVFYSQSTSYFSIKHQVPIVPIGISGSEVFKLSHERETRLRYFWRIVRSRPVVTIKVGTPILPQDDGEILLNRPDDRRWLQLKVAHAITDLTGQLLSADWFS